MEKNNASIWQQAKLSFQNGGRPKKFDTPNDLWEAACKYFQWADDNPWTKNDVCKGGDNVGTKLTVDTQRPYTITGLCVFIGMGTSTFNDYCNVDSKADFSDVTTRIKDIIYSQKFEGAAVGAFQHNIIAMDLGLTAKQDLTTDGNALPKNTVIFNGKEYEI